MSTLIPTDISIPPAREGDPRLGHLLNSALEEEDRPEAVLIGFPCDIGVARNGGRTGAAAGPVAARNCLYRLTPDPRMPEHIELLRRTVDLGDIPVEDDLRAAQQRLADVVGPHLEAGSAVVIIGGGHETAYGHFLAYAGIRDPVSIVNLDAHADVRELVFEGGAAAGKGHSGSPFRQAAEHPAGMLKRYDVFGLQPQALASTHLAYLDDMKGSHAFAGDCRIDDISKAYTRKHSVLATFCLDAVDQSQAPGVSAPTTGGLDTGLWLQAADRAGRSERVKSMDIVELNPAFDRDQQTARLAALTIWTFLRGVSQRD